MDKKKKVAFLAAAGAAASLVVVNGGRATLPAQTTQYPSVQPPAWVGTTAQPAPLPAAVGQWVQPPAWIPIV